MSLLHCKFYVSVKEKSVSFGFVLSQGVRKSCLIGKDNVVSKKIMMELISVVSSLALFPKDLSLVASENWFVREVFLSS